MKHSPVRNDLLAQRASGPVPPEPVVLEVGNKRVFAAALNWPGWCRSARDESLALDALAATAPRYAPVVERAGLTLPGVLVGGILAGGGASLGTPSEASSLAFKVTERLAGSATTDFGAPGAVAGADLEPLAAREAERLTALLKACWSFFDEVVAAGPAQLRKGPRGGGRDRDEVAAHVVNAEAVYARKIGVAGPAPSPGDAESLAAFRDSLSAALEVAWTGEVAERGWPPRYAVRRIAWHVLDHAWEIQDRSTPAAP